MDCQKFSVSAAQKSLGKIYNFWRVANFNKPFRCLVPHEMERLTKRLPFVDSLNLVYMLGGRQKENNCWYQGENPDGTAKADFSGMIDQIRSCLDYGYTPWIVLDNVPYGMTASDTDFVYGNTEPPKNYKLWHSYVKAAMQSIVDAFGLETASKWFYRVGTEPDYYPGHWSGTKPEYFEHYDQTVDAVLSVIPNARIAPGNILNPVEGEYGTVVEDQWGLDIIDHAGGGTNYVTGETGTEMNWFSCSWYGRVGVHVSMFDTAIKMMRERLEKYPQFKDMHIDIGEFTVLHDETGTRLYSGDTTEWSASFYAAIAERVYQYGVEKVYEWHHATEGVMHPKGHVIWMLRQMLDCDRLSVLPDHDHDPDRDYGVLAARRADNEIYLLVYNHCSEREDLHPRKFELSIEDIDDSKNWQMDQWYIDHENTVWAYEFESDCAAAGIEPKEKSARYEGGIEFRFGDPGFELFEANRDKYTKMSELPQISSGEKLETENSQLSLSLDMPSHSVRFIKITSG